MKVGIVGLGLIGGSLGLALQRRGHAVVGWDDDPGVRERALDAGVVEAVVHLPERVAVEADVVVLAVPVGAMRAAVRALLPSLEPTTVLTDTGSTKRDVVARVFAELPEGVVFVPGHPIAGTERSGPEAADAELFAGRTVVLCPAVSGVALEDARAAVETDLGMREKSEAWTAARLAVPTDEEVAAEERVAALWRETGASVWQRFGAGEHDAAMSLLSHLPHAAAFALAATVGGEEGVEPFGLAAGGLRDTTRIAASSPIMWRDVFLQNGDLLIDALRRYRTHLDRLTELIARGDGDGLLLYFREANAAQLRITRGTARRGWKQ